MPVTMKNKSSRIETEIKDDLNFGGDRWGEQQEEHPEHRHDDRVQIGSVTFLSEYQWLIKYFYTILI